MSAEAPPAPAATAAPPAAKGRTAPLVLALSCAVVGVVAGVSVPLRPPAAKDEHAAKAAAAEPATWEMPELIVNLADGRGQRYLKLRCSLRFRAKDEPAARAQLQKRLPEVRDALISLISAKTLEEVAPVEAKESIKLAILDAVNRAVFADGSGTAEKLFFLEFIVQ
jgi:flagellar FliL protein